MDVIVRSVATKQSPTWQEIAALRSQRHVPCNIKSQITLDHSQLYDAGFDAAVLGLDNRQHVIRRLI